MWLAAPQAAYVVERISGKAIGPDTIMHWCGSGCFRCVKYEGDRQLFRDDEIRAIGQQYRQGGKAYLFIFKDGAVYMSSVLISDISGEYPQKVSKALREKSLSGQLMGKCWYAETESAAKWNPLVSDYLRNLNYPG